MDVKEMELQTVLIRERRPGTSREKEKPQTNLGDSQSHGERSRERRGGVKLHEVGTCHRKLSYKSSLLSRELWGKKGARGSNKHRC